MHFSAESMLADFKKENEDIFTAVMCIYEEMDYEGMKDRGIDKLSEFFDNVKVIEAFEIIRAHDESDIKYDDAVHDFENQLEHFEHKGNKEEITQSKNRSNSDSNDAALKKGRKNKAPRHSCVILESFQIIVR